MTTTATFAIKYTQILDEHGKLSGEIPCELNRPETLISLYKTMVKTRIFDKKAIALQRTGKLGTYAPIHGQEAISTAIGHAMSADDVLVPYYRDYAAQLQRGVEMSEILAYWGGDERGSKFANNNEDLPICVPIASQCLHATGVAFAFKYRQQKRVAVTCIGEGGTSEGDFYEAINVAGAWKLPVVFIVNNNHWAISVPLAKQTATETIAQKAIAAGFEGLQVDGNDAIACRHVIGAALAKARRGEGPTLIEALTYRLCDHTTADDATRYQPSIEVEHAQLKEPIQRLKKYLESATLWDDAQQNALVEQCSSFVAQQVEIYLNREPQTIDSAFDYHYAHLPDYLALQRAIALEEVENA